MNKITPNILISSSNITFDNKQNRTDSIPNLKEGQIIEARVIKVISSKQAQLLIDGKKVTAQTYTPLREGENALFKVTSTGVQHVLKLIQTAYDSSTHINLAGLLKNLDRLGPFANIWKLSQNNQLYPLIKSIALKSQSPDTSFLKELIKDGGLSWENKLSTTQINLLNKEEINALINNDLKGLAMHVLDNTDDTKDTTSNNDSQILRVFVQGLEKLQLLNSSSFEESGKLLFPFPILFEEALKFGQILIDLGHHEEIENKGGDNHLVKIAFLLEMSNIGDIQAEFSLFRQAINGMFGVSNNEIMCLIKEDIPMLIENLGRHGFQVQNIGCRVLNPETLKNSSLLDKIINENEGMLNLII